MSNALSENWQFTTLAIEDDLGDQRGTGVLVGETTVHEALADSGYAGPSWLRPKRAYLVTARHVLGASASVIEETLHYRLRYSATTARGLEKRTKQFDINNSQRNWAVHPDKDVDIAILDVTSWLADLDDAHVRICPLSEVASPVSIMQTECDAGDDVFVIGYPLRLRQGSTNLPIFRKGVAASSPGRRLIEESGRIRRGFLIDGAIMPGSSGSPVISASSRHHLGDFATIPQRPLLLGLVAEEWGRSDSDRRLVRNGNELGHGYANLGFAHASSTIIETIVELGHHTIEDFLRLDYGLLWSPKLGVQEWALELDGREVDYVTSARIMLRLHRDRLRKQGQHAPQDDALDAIDIMGPVEEDPK